MAHDRINLSAGADDGGTLPPDLADVAAALERLARHERAAAGAGLEGRVFMASRAGMSVGTPADVEGVDSAAEALAAAERGSAGPALEDRLFMATRRLIAAPEERTADVVVRRVSWVRWARPALAAAAVLALGVGVWLALGTPEKPGNQLAADTNASPAPADDTGVAREALTLEVAHNPISDDDLDVGLSGHFSELRSEMDALSQNLRGDWFELGQLLHEEAM